MTPARLLLLVSSVLVAPVVVPQDPPTVPRDDPSVRHVVVVERRGWETLEGSRIEGLTISNDALGLTIGTGNEGVVVTLPGMQLIAERLEIRTFDVPPKRDELLRLEQVWNDAHVRGDVAALGALWADELTIVEPGLEPMTREQAVELSRSAPSRFGRYESGDVEIQPLGESALVTGTLLVSRGPDRPAADERWHFTKLYQRRDGVWRVLRFHASQSPD